MPVKSRNVIPVAVILFLGIAAVVAGALAGYVLSAGLAVAAVATTLWPRWVAYQFRDGVFGSPRRMVTRTISLGLSTPRPDTIPADNYGDYEPKYEHWSNAYGGVSIAIVLLGLQGDNWQAAVGSTVVLLIGWFVLLGRVRRDAGTSEAQLVK